MSDNLFKNHTAETKSLASWSGNCVRHYTHTNTETMEKIKDLAGLCIPTAEKLERMLIKYVESTGDLRNGRMGINSLHFNGCCDSGSD